LKDFGMPEDFLDTIEGDVFEDVHILNHIMEE
jgi:hypothetical protein